MDIITQTHGKLRFMSKENIQLIIGTFISYMKDNHSITFEKNEMDDLKKTIFSIMNVVMKKYPKDTEFHKLNVEVLTIAKGHYISSHTRNKPNIKNLDREKVIFGDRKVTINELIPKGDPYLRRPGNESDQNLDKYINEREQQFKRESPVNINIVASQAPENAEDPNIFMLKLKQLEEDRAIVDQRMEEDREFRVNNTVENVDPKVLYTINDKEVFQSELAGLKDNSQLGSKSTISSTIKIEDDLNKPFNTRQDLIIESKSKEKIRIQKYISINSVDREWEIESLRYNYAIPFNGKVLLNTYKNIRSIQVGRVVIPEEIIENINVLNYPNKTQFNHEFSFSYPYLILRIDEFNDVYDGTNDNVRKSFCKLIYHRSYKSPNGRGYVILKPFQCEKKYFYPNPLSTISRLTISILKPNGFLFNNSSDSYKIFKIYYDPFNPNYYTVVCDVFFDKNEFFVGDVIIFKGYAITSTSNLNSASTLNTYINRPDGHEILQIGSPNNNGFYRSFYISAIGEFNKYEGKFDIDNNAVNVMNDYNDTIDFSTFTGTNGYILNNSLQNTIGMNLDILVPEFSSS